MTLCALIFMNSRKMKLSVLFGVLRIIVGLLLRWINTIFKRFCLDFICECIPMMIFMLCFFGWMDFMILYERNLPESGPPPVRVQVLLPSSRRPRTLLFRGYVGDLATGPWCHRSREWRELTR